MLECWHLGGNVSPAKPRRSSGYNWSTEYARLFKYTATMQKAVVAMQVEAVPFVTAKSGRWLTCKHIRRAAASSEDRAGASKGQEELGSRLATACIYRHASIAAAEAAAAG